MYHIVGTFVKFYLAVSVGFEPTQANALTGVRNQHITKLCQLTKVISETSSSPLLPISIPVYCTSNGGAKQMHYETRCCCPTNSTDSQQILQSIEELIDTTYNVYRRLSKKMAKLSEQVEELTQVLADLNDAVAAEKEEVGDKLADLADTIAALELRIIELGEPDPDVQNLIDSAKDSLEDVRGIVDTPMEPAPPVEPTEPEVPVEEPVEEPTVPVEEPVEEPTEDTGEVTPPADGGETFPADDENA